MGEKTTAASRRGEDFLEEAKAAGRARIAEALADPDAVEWAEKTADRLEQRLRNRAAS